jgi:hypothetical protein
MKAVAGTRNLASTSGAEFPDNKVRWLLLGAEGIMDTSISGRSYSLRLGSDTDPSSQPIWLPIIGPLRRPRRCEVMSDIEG